MQETIVEHSVVYLYKPDYGGDGWFCLIVDGKVLHDDNKPVSDRAWIEAIRAVGSINIARSVQVVSQQEIDQSRLGMRKSQEIAKWLS